MPFWKRKTDAWLIVGLGNAGGKYKRNRHNIGFMCLDEFARGHKIVFGRARLQAKVAEGKVQGIDVVLAKPLTFVNLSGEAVGGLMRKHGVKAERLIVVHDDMDLPVGKIRIKSGGSSGGHKGIKSITGHICTEEFSRIRVGIGRPDSESGARDREEVIEHVLGDFSAAEQVVIDKVIPAVMEALLILLMEGLTAAMNKCNGIDFTKATPDK